MFKWLFNYRSMPRVPSPKTAVQRAFSPLMFRARFSSEVTLYTTHPSQLPWRITYPLHGEGTPADDINLASGGSVSQAPSAKMKHPMGEPGQAAPRSFPVKETLGLPNLMYDQMLVSIAPFSPPRF